ncbi:MAG: ATP-binding protein [Pseudomonadota bacterium]
MSFSLTQILLFIIAYLSGLFAVAHLADRGLLPRAITHHPAVYVLSLGVFAGAMATNGAMALAQNYGFNFLLYYVGVVIIFAIGTFLLLPLLRLCRVYQLSSIADVLTFRFRSPWVGAAITIAMCLTLMPLLALEIQAVAESIFILAGGQSEPVAVPDRFGRLALLFCLIITVFSILFGTRHVSSHYRNTGLVNAIAFESLVKLCAMLALMIMGVYGAFGSVGELQSWLADNPQVDRYLQPVGGAESRALLLMFFAGAVCMPHLFHMAFAENTESRDMSIASWALPLYLLLLSLPVLPIAWAALRLDTGLVADYSGLAIALGTQSTAIAAMAFVACLSAASATIIVTTLALANMCLNHLVLPLGLRQIDRNQSIYPQLRWLRRGLIAILILGAYGFHLTLGGSETLTGLALVAFSGTLQFLPGILATPYWDRANRLGLMTGLTAGLGLWFWTMLLPLTGDYQPTFMLALLERVPGVGDELWSAATVCSLLLNTILFVVVSLLTPTSKSQQVAAEICSMDTRTRPTRQILSVHSAAAFADKLAPALGETTARSEVQLALGELQFSVDETRPYALRRLRARIEANLAGLLGPAVALRIIERSLPLGKSEAGATEDMQFIESGLDQAQANFTGLAADLDNLRRYHRETLDRLPMGACSISADGELLMWNRSMEAVTGIPSETVLGSLVNSLPLPWRDLVVSFRDSPEDATQKSELTLSNGKSRWICLHKAVVTEADAMRTGEMVILVEDTTEVQTLEQELLHNERLASIGRLAAGVAHEIGNPVTGIACLAQNLEYETEPDEIRVMAQDILKQTGRVNRIVESLMNFSHIGETADNQQLGPANLADCVDEAIHLLTLVRDAKPVRFSNDCDRELVVLADSQRLLQVFVNLLSNARDACNDYGEVCITAGASDEAVHIHVEDNGTGVPPELHSQVFEPFFTTKDPGAGTGLGLALVYSIMDDMNGRVQLVSPIGEAPNLGTRVSLMLPRTNYGQAFQV